MPFLSDISSYTIERIPLPYAEINSLFQLDRNLMRNLSETDLNYGFKPTDSCMDQSIHELSIIKRENEILKFENKKARKILKELIDQLNKLHLSLVYDKQASLEAERKNEETINKLQNLNFQLKERNIALEAENVQLKAFKNELVNRARSLDNNISNNTNESNKNSSYSRNNSEETQNQIEQFNSESLDSQVYALDSSLNKKLKRKGAKKFNFPAKAVDFLIENYNRNKFPDNIEIKNIANEINLTPQQVNKWFRDRRHKLEETKVNAKFLIYSKLLDLLLYSRNTIDGTS